MKGIRKHFALCIDNTDYEVSLIPGKVYRVIPDYEAAEDDLVRIIDESGEDYLYHKDYFAFVGFPKSVEMKLMKLEPSTRHEGVQHSSL
jgi:hypothetical protein